MKQFVITATDTDVGKTYITALLAKSLVQSKQDVMVVKPYATGCVDPHTPCDDVQFIKQHSGLAAVASEMQMVTYRQPVSPLAAELMSEPEQDLIYPLRKIEELCEQHEYVLIEGIGGVMVPLKSGYYFSDFIQELGFPCVIVARSSLGTLNHTLLTVDHLRRLGIEIIGLVLNDVQQCSSTEDPSLQTNAKILQRETGLPLLMHVPHRALDSDFAVPKSFWTHREAVII